MFHLKDTVRKAANHQKIGAVVDIRDMEPRYNIQFGKDPKDKEWISEWVKDNDLELVAEAEDSE